MAETQDSSLPTRWRPTRRMWIAIVISLVAVALLAHYTIGSGSGWRYRTVAAASATTTPATAVPVTTTTTGPLPVPTTTDPCAVTTGTLDQACGADTPTGQALAARESCALSSLSNLFGKTPPPPAGCPDLSGAPATPKTVPPCTGSVTGAITVSNVPDLNGSYDVTVNATVRNGRTDPIDDVVVTYGFPGLSSSYQDETGTPTPLPIPLGGSATFSSTYYGFEFDVQSATVTSVIYSDTASGSGCGNGSQP